MILNLEEQEGAEDVAKMILKQYREEPNSTFTVNDKSIAVKIANILRGHQLKCTVEPYHWEVKIENKK